MELDSGDMMARKETRIMMEAFSRGEKIVYGGSVWSDFGSAGSGWPGFSSI
jgi:hypothetical protein